MQKDQETLTWHDGWFDLFAQTGETEEDLQKFVEDVV